MISLLVARVCQPGGGLALHYEKKARRVPNDTILRHRSCLWGPENGCSLDGVSTPESPKETARVESQVTDDLELLLGVMPPHLYEAIEKHPAKNALIEIVLDLGRAPEVRLPDRGETISEEPITREDLVWV